MNGRRDHGSNARLETSVKRVLIIGGAAAVAVLLARRFAPKLCNVDWEQRIEALPDTAPPKWMFSNIKAIRENSDRILQILTEDRARP